MSSKKLDTGQFLELGRLYPIIDVRSPLEFEAGHVPGALNIPLFDNDQRVDVGIKYKKEGRTQAIIEGLKKSGPDMFQKLEKALHLSSDGKLLVHCWRGGMRSEAMAWLFSLAGIETYLLEGGYKSYRHYILDKLSHKRNIIILGGMTGSSKTHILRFLKKTGNQVIDLEGIANHKGSAFGALGQAPQPTTEQFANNLFDKWKDLDPGLPVWLEDESRSIGTVFLPEMFYLNMQDTKTIVLMMDVKTRLPRLMEEYSVFPADDLKAAILRISKRLGGDNTTEANKAIEAGDISRAIEISLSYYDKTYQYGMKKKKPENIVFVETDTDDIEVNAMKVLDASRKLL